jgi:hypothetical protein
VGKNGGRVWERTGLQDVLETHPRLRIVPTPYVDALSLKGSLAFDADLAGVGSIRDDYRIAIMVPFRFPLALPSVRELGSRISSDFHTNPDGTLCLGSPVRLHLALADGPTLLGFIERCIVPFLAGYTYLERTGREWTPGLAHGDAGLIDDYMSLLRVRDKKGCVEMMDLMGMKRRIANKLPCPCGSLLRVGRCHHRVLNDLRLRLGRRWWKNEHAKWHKVT